MKIDSGRFKKILRHISVYDENYRNKVFTNLSESDLKFVRTQTSKNVPSEDNRFEDYVISFSDDDLSMLFDCFETIDNANVEQEIKMGNKEILSGVFLANKMLESIMEKNPDAVRDYLDYDNEKLEKINGVFKSRNPRGLAYSKLGFLYPSYNDIWHLSHHANNTMVFNFMVDNLEEGVESDTMLQEQINDYLANDRLSLTRIFTTKDRLITPQCSSKQFVQPVHDYDLITGIEYNPSM